MSKKKEKKSEKKTINFNDRLLALLSQNSVAANLIMLLTDDLKNAIAKDRFRELGLEIPITVNSITTVLDMLGLPTEIGYSKKYGYNIDYHNHKEKGYDIIDYVDIYFRLADKYEKDKIKIAHGMFDFKDFKREKQLNNDVMNYFKSLVFEAEAIGMQQKKAEKSAKPNRKRKPSAKF